jgi:tetratricopeptide (TPR) repeat protein
LLFQDQDGSWSTPFDQTTVDYQELPIPKSIRDLIELRMDNLSAEADAFLKAAAVIGNQFDPEIAQEASELTTDQRDEAVDELATAQLVVAQDLIYCFKHNLHREAVYSAIKPGERRKLHARTGHALLEVIDPSPTLSDIQALADHFYRGEVWDKALTYQLKAGVGALKLYDARTTRRYLQSARRLMERKLRVSVQRVETTPNGFRTRLRQGLVDCFSEEELHTLCFDVGLDYESLPALGKAGKAREIVAYFERINSVSGLVEQCRRLRPNGPWDETPERLQLRQVPIETQLTCLEGLGDAEALLGHFDEARNCYEAALERNPVGGKGRLFVKLADTLYRQAQLDEAADRLQRSFEALEAQPDPSAQSRAHLLMGMIHVQKGEIPQALEETTQALAVESGLAHLLMAIVRRERGELELAITHCQRGIALAEAAKDPVTLAKGHTNLGVLLMDAGRFDEARQTYQRGLEMQAAIGDAFMHALTLCNLAEAHRYLGDLDQSLHLARAGLEGFQKQKSAFGQALAHLNLGEALLEQGEPRKARLEHLEVARRLLEQKGITANLCDVLLAIVECSLAEGVSADAQQAVGRARQVAEKEEDAGDRANALRVLGILRQRQGKRDEAEDALHQSEEAFRALGQRYALGRTRLAQAEFYAADPARLAEARTALDEAREIFEMLGAAQQLKRVQELEPIP